MSGGDDQQGDMRLDRALDEREIEAVLRGRVPPGRPDLEPLAQFVQVTRAGAAGPPPDPSPALARLLAGGLTAAEPAAPAGRREIRRAGRARGPAGRITVRRAVAAAAMRAAGLGAAAKLAAAASVVTLSVAGVTGAGAAGVLPAPVQSVVADSVESITPFTIPHPADPRAPGSNGIGDRVREQARHHGSDPRQGTGTGTPKGTPATPGGDGLERAGGRPAGPHRSGKDKPGKDKAGNENDGKDKDGRAKPDKDQRSANPGWPDKAPGSGSPHPPLPTPAPGHP